MPADNISRYIGDLKLRGELSDLYAKTPDEFIQKFLANVYAEFPEGSQNVLYTNEQPKDSDRLKIWFRTTATGSFEGIYIYFKGKWNKIYPLTGEIKWIYGDSSQPQDLGWKVINEDDNFMNPSEIAQLKSAYILKGDGSGSYVYYAVRYVGF